MSDDSLPTSLRRRARHARRLVGAGARFGLRRLVRRDEADADALGRALVGELDTLKGMAMKVGQILSYMDGVIPAQTQTHLARLQRGARPHPWPEMRAVIESSLGATINDLYDQIDPEPVAAASIGQVHRARIDSQNVAVKVQYPGIRDSFEADVRQLRRLSALAGLGTRVDGQAIVDDLRDRLIEECDYLHEARWQSWFADRFADDPSIRIPSVVPERSTDVVLTTRWHDGLTLEQRLIQGGPEARQHAARTLARMAWTSLFALGVINADPHPGNQLFCDGAVVFLDFGCVRQFGSVWLQATRSELRAVLDGDRAAFREALLRSGQVPRPKRFDFDAHWAMQRHLWQPYLSDTFRFTPDWLRAGAAFTGPGNANLRQLAIAPEWVWLSRLQWGLHAVLVRLGAQGRYREILGEALDSTPKDL